VHARFRRRADRGGSGSLGRRRYRQPFLDTLLRDARVARLARTCIGYQTGDTQVGERDETAASDEPGARGDGGCGLPRRRGVRVTDAAFYAFGVTVAWLVLNLGLELVAFAWRKI
jgi:hypothetical protein